jgi:hypothetical protein
MLDWLSRLEYAAKRLEDDTSDGAMSLGDEIKQNRHKRDFPLACNAILNVSSSQYVMADPVVVRFAVVPNFCPAF